MGRRNRRGNATKTRQQQVKAAASVPPLSKPKVGLLVTDEFEKAVAQCRAAVEQIAKDCKAKNRKFRDIEFDLDNDKHLCLNGLLNSEGEEHTPTGVVRVADIYSQPQFFIDGAGSNDIVQGRLGNCWFLSALSNAYSLAEQFCVARDEKVGVYGFLFFKNGSWVNVIIDDLLYVHVPKFEELSYSEQLLFHGDKRKYNQTARKGGKNLYFARSGTEDETWVPLIEKAYAKLHGDYSSLDGGMAAEALEDLTGGVSSTIRIKDILDPDRFWEEELLRANSDRLFNAGYYALDSTRSGQTRIEVEGLIGSHAYSVLKAVQVNGKRFVVVRNPWGQSEWKGPWSDGSKEWTTEWLTKLPEIGHIFGNDGQFVMEYSDFLEHFENIDRTILFDASWKMSMEWLRVPVRPPPAAWSFGDVSFNFTIQRPTRAVIVLSKLDDRYFKGVEGSYNWNLQFLVYKIGDEDVTFITESEQSVFGNRSVNTEADLQPGNYAVHVRMDGLFKGPVPDQDNFDKRKLARVLTERSQARLIASNYNAMAERLHFPIPLDVLLGREKPIADARTKAISSPVAAGVSEDAAAEPGEAATETKAGDGDEPKTTSTKAPKGINEVPETPNQYKETPNGANNGSAEESEQEEEGNGSDDEDDGDPDHSPSSSKSDTSGSEAENEKEPKGAKEEDNSEPLEAFIGLRIYTQGGGEQVEIIGTIKEEADRLYVSSVLDSAA